MSARSRGRPGADRQSLLGAAVAAVGLLIFVWPLVRSPPLALPEAFFHLFGWWAALVAVLAVRAWTAGRASRSAPPEEDVD